MKKSQIVSSLVMCGVITLLIIQFTVAWYSGRQEQPSVTGIHMQAAAGGGIKVAVTPGGNDILQLAEEEQFVSIGLEELNNIPNGEFAPGAYGDAVFYVTPLSADVTGCQIIPGIVLDAEADAEPTASPDVEPTASPDAEPAASPAISEELQTVMNRHIQFFTDEAMTVPIDETNPMLQVLEWDTATDAGKETKVTVYWKWHYEYPFTAEESGLTEEERKAKIEQYDEEDTQIGNSIERMHLQFELAPLT